MEKRYYIRKSVFLYEASLKNFCYLLLVLTWIAPWFISPAGTQFRSELLRFAVYITFTIGVCWYLVHILFGDLRKTEITLQNDRLFKVTPSKNIELPFSQISGFVYKTIDIWSSGIIRIESKYSFKLSPLLDKCDELIQTLEENPQTSRYFASKAGENFKIRTRLAEFNAKETTKTFWVLLCAIAACTILNGVVGFSLWSLPLSRTLLWILVGFCFPMAAYCITRILLFYRAYAEQMKKGTLLNLHTGSFYRTAFTISFVVYLLIGVAYHFFSH